MFMKAVKLAAIGCGNRTSVYLSLAKEIFGDKIKITALADPVKARRDEICTYQEGSEIKQFDTASDFFKEGKLADAVIIGTQDDYHFEPAMEALEKGYDIILEKPISNKLEDVLVLDKKAQELDRKVIICHVLRYTPFYNKIKEIIASGILGELVTVNATEGVGAWHMAHSFVRGKWSDTKKSSPMILAKSCHDMDIIHWLVQEPCVSVSSFGSLSFFRKENAPKDAPLRCTDGCPVSESCQYNALLYMNEQREPWLSVVLDQEAFKKNTGGASDEEILNWLKTSLWGRCVFHCDNDAVDHQVVTMEFEKGITATFTMTAFDEGRNIEICGTKGTLKGGEFTKEISGHDIVYFDNRKRAMKTWDVDFDAGWNKAHAGGDFGFVSMLYDQLMLEEPADLKSSIHDSVESHVMAWAAEAARREKKTVRIQEFLEEIDNGS